MTARVENVTFGFSGAGAASLTVSAGMAKGLVDFAAGQGADRAALLTAARLHPQALAHDDARIPFARYVALYAAAEDLCADPALALHFGECLEGMDLLVCHVGSASPTMGGALAAMNQYGRLAVDLETVGGADPFRVEVTHAGTWLIDASVYPGNVSQVTDTSFARLITGTRQLSQRQFVRAVHLVRSAPSFRHEYERVFGAPVSFGQRRNAMLMVPAWFALELPVTSRYADTVLEAHAERLMEDLDAARRCRRSVTEWLTSRLIDGGTTMSAVARDLGMSRASLYRALRAEGTSFERIGDQVRRDLATRLLGEGRSVSETADRLGFSDRSAFSRAFKRWTGTSPRSFSHRSLSLKP